jgi:hypothetical protein
VVGGAASKAASWLHYGQQKRKRKKPGKAYFANVLFVFYRTIDLGSTFSCLCGDVVFPLSQCLKYYFFEFILEYDRLSIDLF